MWCVVLPLYMLRQWLVFFCIRRLLSCVMCHHEAGRNLQMCLRKVSKFLWGYTIVTCHKTGYSHIHCLHYNKCLFICIFLQRILLKLLVFVMCFGSVLFYICKLVLNYILFCIINIIACYIYANLLCLQTTMGSVLSHWTCCTNWYYIVSLCFIYHLFVYMICCICTPDTSGV